MHPGGRPQGRGLGRGCLAVRSSSIGVHYDRLPGTRTRGRGVPVAAVGAMV